MEEMDLKQRKRRRTLLVLAVLAVLLLVVGLVVRGWIRMPDVPDPPSVLPEPGQTATDQSQRPAGLRREGVYTFLVAGKDVASGSTDTMLLLTYDTKAKTITGLNLPRDTMMNVTTNSKRLNAVFTYNKGKDKNSQVVRGMTALKNAVADLTGIFPDFYVLVEWEAIGELVDAIGGVEFEVPFDMDYDDPYQDPPLHIHQKAGKRTLNGDDAMQVIRWRKNNTGGGEGGDIARLGIQQDFLKSVVKQCLQPATLLKLSSLVEIFKNNVETDLTVGNILAFAEQAIGMDPATGVAFHTAPIKDSFYYNKAALITLDPEGTLEIINSSMNPYAEDITVEELEMVVRKSDGTFTVTSGTIAENINQYANPPKAEPAPEPEPEPVPEEPVEGETPAEGEVPEEGEIPEQGEPGAEGETPVEGEPPAEGEPSSEPEVPSEEEVPAPEQEPAPEVTEESEIPAEPVPEEVPEVPAA